MYSSLDVGKLAMTFRLHQRIRITDALDNFRGEHGSFSVQSPRNIARQSVQVHRLAYSQAIQQSNCLVCFGFYLFVYLQPGLLVRQLVPLIDEPFQLFGLGIVLRKNMRYLSEFAAPSVRRIPSWPGHWASIPAAIPDSTSPDPPFAIPGFPVVLIQTYSCGPAISVRCPFNTVQHCVSLATLRAVETRFSCT